MMKLPLTTSIVVLLSAAHSVATADELLKQMPAVFERAGSQTRLLLESAKDSDGFPRTIKDDGKLVTVKATDWTSGFFPGTLWLLHEADPDGGWKDKAWEYTRRLESIRHFRGHHDGGFMLGCSYGNALRLDPSEESRAVLRDGAAALGTRFVPELGMIRSWDFKPYTCPVIIDNMMNLELLTWAAKNGGDAKLRELSITHSDKTLANHFRPDGSAYHVIDYDPATGWMRAIYGMQGADVRTAWARGQAWALYGFTMIHRETGKPEYLEQAEKVAQFIMNHPNLPGDGVPMWDFSAKPDSGAPRDASAGAIMASALIELSTLANDGGAYREFAARQLRTLSSPEFLAEPGSHGGFILTRSTGHLPGKSEINVPLNYADYYFLEALLRYQAAATGKARTSFGEAR
jgi:unsaturated chondroitin disaccharide hydrolase